MTIRDELLEGVLHGAIFPALADLPPKFYTPEALQLQLAIGLQESKLKDRWQVLNGGRKGPARGLWQFEQGGGVKGVLKHAATATLAAEACARHGVPATPAAVWAALENNDVLAATFARLLMWTDPKPLPAPNDTEGGWAYYERNWRPGKPHPATWPAHWVRCRRFVFGS